MKKGNLFFYFKETYFIYLFLIGRSGNMIAIKEKENRTLRYSSQVVTAYIFPTKNSPVRNVMIGIAPHFCVIYAYQ